MAASDQQVRVQDVSYGFNSPLRKSGFQSGGGAATMTTSAASELLRQDFQIAAV
jgi:hypothetical protein